MSAIERLREIVRAGASRTAPVRRELTYEPVDPDGLPIDRSGLPALPGATMEGTPFGPVSVIERTYGAGEHYGRVRVDECDVVSPEALAVLTGRPVCPRAASWDRPVFVDLETTGLSGGAGTVAFLVGCGWFDRGDFRTRQFLLNGFAAERALLHLAADLLVCAPFIVTYNGRTFDLPVMEMRWQFHRMATPVDDLPHVDMLPPSRRLWKAAPDGSERSCRLVHLEEALFGVARIDDVPGFEIPQRYFAFVRGGDPAALEPVLEHNRLDLLSLAAVTARAQRLVESGADHVREACECLALGRLYRRARRCDEAEQCFLRAASFADAAREVRAQALLERARLLRRQRRFREAAVAWHELIELGHGRSRAGREAVEALAVHYEHRARDLATARQLAMRSLRAEQDLRRREAVRHRVSRLDRKLAAGAPAAASPRLLDGDGMPGW